MLCACAWGFELLDPFLSVLALITFHRAALFLFCLFPLGLYVPSSALADLQFLLKLPTYPFCVF